MRARERGGRSARSGCILASAAGGAPSGTGIKDTCPVNGSRPRIASAIASATRHHPSYLSWCTARRADSSSQTALRTRREPWGHSAQIRHSRSPKRAGRSGRRPGAGTGRHRDRQIEQISASPSRVGDRRVAEEARGRQEPALDLRASAASAKRSIHRRAHDLGRARPRRETSARRRHGALRHQHGAAVGGAAPRGAHAPAPRRLARASTPCRARPPRRARPPARRGAGIVGDEAERRRVDEHAALGRRRDRRPASSGPSARTRRRRSSERESTATAAPRRAAAIDAARALPPVPR